MKEDNNIMIGMAKRLAADAINEAVGKTINGLPDHLRQGTKRVIVYPEDMYIVWFSKTLQNWKALVSTDKINSTDPYGDYVAFTHTGDKGETYFDVYRKVLNRVY